MENLILKIYNPGGTVEKEIQGKPLDIIPYGVMRKVFEVVSVEDLKNEEDLIRLIMRNWKTLENLLKMFFSDLEDGDLDRADFKQVVSVMVEIMGFMFSQLNNIPGDDSKN